MKKIKGFKIGRRIVRISRRILCKTQIRRFGYSLLCPTRSACNPKPIAKLISWGRRLTKGARQLCSTKPSFGYVPIGQDPIKNKPEAVPKGHLAVYVGQKDGDFNRVLVPVFYFNHPLFGELLREAEEEYGFCQEGGITIPCPFSDFERVQTRIAAGSGTRKLPWKRHY